MGVTTRLPINVFRPFSSLVSVLSCYLNRMRTPSMVFQKLVGTITLYNGSLLYSANTIIVCYIYIYINRGRERVRTGRRKGLVAALAHGAYACGDVPSRRPLAHPDPAPTPNTKSRGSRRPAHVPHQGRPECIVGVGNGSKRARRTGRSYNEIYVYRSIGFSRDV